VLAKSIHQTEVRAKRSSAFFILASSTLIIWGLHSAQSFLIPILLAALVSFLMMPLTRLLKRMKLPEFLCVTLSTIVLLLVLASGFYMIISETQSLVGHWPELSESLQRVLSGFRETSLAHRLHLTEILNTQAIKLKLDNNIGSGLRLAIAGLEGLLSAGTLLFVVVFFSVLMLASRAHLRRSFVYLLSSYSNISSETTIDRMGLLIETFLLARMGIAIAVGAVGLIAMSIIGIPYSVVLADFFGLMTWVPIIGFFVGILPMVVVALAVGVHLQALAIVFFSLGTIWTFQDNVLTPKFVGHQLKLNFLCTYIAFFAGEAIWGPWGMFLSVPLLGITRIALRASPLEPWAFLLGEEDDRSSGDMHVSSSHQRKHPAA
jgi:predicted PurR-regulated permease PerM